jgi:ferredoxin
MQLAERIWQEDHALVQGITDESKAFRIQAESSEELYQRADKMQHRLTVGAIFLGAWMGLVIALRLIRHTVYRPKQGYDADPAACLSCARCYLFCPVEHERIRQLEAAAP